MTQLSSSPLPKRAKQLLEAALFVFGKKGYPATQVSDIIERAGVARGTFYLYFKSKREIFSHVLDHIFLQVRSVVESLPRDKAALHLIPEKIRGNLERITNLFSEHPAYARVLLCESVSFDSECNEKLKEFYGQLLDLIGRAVRQGQEMGFVRTSDSRFLAIFLLGLIKELFYQKILSTISFKPEEVVLELYQMIVAAVSKPGLAG